jgi:drug/metabolite transporter (DMT)-like permease
MISFGVLFGLLAAFFQSLAYLATRYFVTVRDGGSRLLLVLSHIIMGVASLAVLPWIWPADLPSWRLYLEPLFSVSVFYLLGQLALLVALRYADPSRISPMLAFKIVILAGMAILLHGTVISLPQWGAIALCLVGVVMLNYTGGASHPRAAVAIVLACLLYSFSDWNIARLVHVASPHPNWKTFTWATLSCYVLCGLIAAMFLPWYGSRKPKDWIDAGPFAGMWLAAMLLLFACIGLEGVVYGNILQSTRGIISVLLGAILAATGLLHLEKAHGNGVFARRMIAAIFMLGAVVLYGWEKQQLDQPRNPSTNNQASVGYESHAKTVTLIRPPSATLAPGF